MHLPGRINKQCRERYVIALGVLVRECVSVCVWYVLLFVDEMVVVLAGGFPRNIVSGPMFPQKFYALLF